MNENEKMQAVEEDLQSVAGGNQDYINKIEQDVQVTIVPEEDKKKIDSLIRRYHFFSQFVQHRIMTTAYGGPSWFEENGRQQENLKGIENELRFWAKKYSHYPGLERFLPKNK